MRSKACLRFSVGLDLVMVSVEVGPDTDVESYCREVFERERFPEYLRSSFQRCVEALVALEEEEQGAQHGAEEEERQEEEEQEAHEFSEAFAFLCSLGAELRAPLAHMEDSMARATRAMLSEGENQVALLRAAQHTQLGGSEEDLVAEHVEHMAILERMCERELRELATAQREEFASFVVEYASIQRGSEPQASGSEAREESRPLPGALLPPPLSWVARVGPQLHAIHLGCEALLSLCEGGAEWRFERVRDLYTGHAAALIFPVDTLDWRSSERQRRLARLCESSPELHFAPYKEQLGGDDALLELGDFKATQHSNLLLPHYVFHVASRAREPETLSEDRLVQLLCHGALQRIMRACHARNVSTLVVPLFMASEKHASELIVTETWEKRARGVLQVVRDTLHWRQTLQLPPNADSALATVRLVLPPHCEQPVIDACCAMLRQEFDLIPQ